MADDARNNLKSFTAYTAPRTGRMKGARNKLGADFLRPIPPIALRSLSRNLISR